LTSGRSRTLVMTAVIGILAGGAVALLAFLVARYGPSGDGWSFRGNGALAIYALVPALLAAGWAAMIARARGRRSWLSLGAAAGAVGVLLALADALLIPVFGTSADATAGAVLLVALVAWIAIAPLLAAFLPARDSGTPDVSTGIAGAVVWVSALFAGLAAMGYIIPAGS
jgi:hypothetical protein